MVGKKSIRFPFFRIFPYVIYGLVIFIIIADNVFIIIALPDGCALHIAQFVDFSCRKCFQCTNKFGKAVFGGLHARFGWLHIRRGRFETILYGCIATIMFIVDLYYCVEMIGHYNMFVQNNVGGLSFWLSLWL